ncbi:16S rRNA (uracil(1498)-N(3))-methyltransferase [Leptothermofonsia sp. ETS-13]|uniref:16S rRNA (uracil(1498)-N(3))-methyltransferase n=1 Tax=Leptothermofonsia sp. ETS-13 TaxID=3035696 RepID=UPI003B9E13C7
MQRLVVDLHQICARRVVLTPEQIHYLGRVLRLRVGDRFVAMDGKGQSWIVKLVEGEASPFEAELLEAIALNTELPIAVTLVMALPKGSGFDEVVRQATELGVTCIAPVISDRTLLHPSPQRLKRWQRIVQEAAEQSERQIVPTLLEPVSFSKHLQDMRDRPSTHYLCVTRSSAPHILTCLLPNTCPPLSITIAIGPEGGWTEAEVEQAIATGYQPISLGSRILRAVTAPVVALSLVAAVCETSGSHQA